MYHVERRVVRDERRRPRISPQRLPHSIGGHAQRPRHLLAGQPVPVAQPLGVLEQRRFVRFHRGGGGGDVAPLFFRDCGDGVGRAFVHVRFELVRVGRLDVLAARWARHRGSASARRVTFLFPIPVLIRRRARAQLCRHPRHLGGGGVHRELARRRVPGDPSLALELGESRGGDAHALGSRAGGLERADDGELFVVGLAGRVVVFRGERGGGRRRGRGHDDAGSTLRVPTKTKIRDA